ncbi:MAG: cell filamentation protein Fic, partial [Ignavibacteria bacterium]|nr:cell filamentation protein Fic [Ignavibacteria bacterium]
LDDFVKMTGNTILQNAGTISREQALKKANTEYEKFKELTKNELSEVEKHFVKQIENTVKKMTPKKPKK